MHFPLVFKAVSDQADSVSSLHLEGEPRALRERLYAFDSLPRHAIEVDNLDVGISKIGTRPGQSQERLRESLHTAGLREDVVQEAAPDLRIVFVPGQEQLRGAQNRGYGGF